MNTEGVKHNHVTPPKCMNTVFHPFICYGNNEWRVQRQVFCPTVTMKGAGDEHDTAVQSLSTHVPPNTAVKQSAFLNITPWFVWCKSDHQIVAEPLLRQGFVKHSWRTHCRLEGSKCVIVLSSVSECLMIVLCDLSNCNLVYM